MSSTNLSSVAGAVKRIYDDYVERTQNLEHRAIDTIGKSAKKYNAGGEGFFGAINDYGNESGGAINETESFRTIDSEHYQQWKVSPKVIVWPIEFSGLVAKAADGDDESFVNAVVDALDQAKERLLKDENRQFFGLGTGLLASPSGAVASDVTSFAVDTTQYLRANMVVDIYSASTKSVTAQRISRVDRQNNVIYFSTSLGVALNATMEIVKENIRVSAPSDGKEMMGLRGIVDDSTDLTTFQNISAATNDDWRSVRIDAASGNLTSDLMQRLLDDVATLGGDEPDLLITHRKQRRKYLDIVTADKRYLDGKMDAGFTKLSFNGKEMILDNDCQASVMYALKKAAIRKFEVAPLEMASHDGSDQFLRIANKDAYQAYWRHYSNFGTSKRNAHGKIIGLATPSGVS
jgi:hypothetical protein